MGTPTLYAAQESADCSNVNVDTQYLPDNRSQDDLEWCHSYSLADLYSFYAKKKVSAFGIAAQSYQSIVLNSELDRPNLASWKSDPLFNFAYIAQHRNDLCLEENFNTSQKSAEKFSSVFTKLENSIPNIESRRCINGYNDLAANIDEATLRLINKLSGGGFVTALINSKCVLKTEIPHGSLSRWDARANISVSCPYPPDIDKKNPDSLNCKKEKHKAHDQVPWKMINKKLSKSEPVIVYYDASLLLKTPTDPAKDYRHYSTLVGRRLNPKTQKCEYLLRNIWGTDCSQYPSRFECEEGNIWITESDLKKNAQSYLTFESTEPTKP